MPVELINILLTISIVAAIASSVLRIVDGEDAVRTSWFLSSWFISIILALWLYISGITPWKVLDVRDYDITKIDNAQCVVFWQGKETSIINLNYFFGEVIPDGAKIRVTNHKMGPYAGLYYCSQDNYKIEIIK